MRTQPRTPRSIYPRLFGAVSLLFGVPVLLVSATCTMTESISIQYAVVRVQSSGTAADGSVRWELDVPGLGKHYRSRPVSQEKLAALVRGQRFWAGGIGVVSLLLVIVGLGQVSSASWAWPASQLWGFVALLFLLYQTFFFIPEFSIRARDVCQAAIGYRQAMELCPAYPLGQRLLFALVLGTYPATLLAYFSATTPPKGLGS